MRRLSEPGQALPRHAPPDFCFTPMISKRNHQDTAYWYEDAIQAGFEADWNSAPDVAEIKWWKMPSAYGDPEAALQAEPYPFEIAITEEQRELERVLNLIEPLDRILLMMTSNGATQTVMAEYAQITQPSICGRLKRIREWTTYVVPLRLKLREIQYPSKLTLEHRALIEHVIWRHGSVSEYARIHDHPWCTAYCRFLRAVQLTKIHNAEPVKEVFEKIMDHIGVWIRPGLYTPRLDETWYDEFFSAMERDLYSLRKSLDP